MKRVLSLAVLLAVPSVSGVAGPMPMPMPGGPAEAKTEGALWTRIVEREGNSRRLKPFGTQSWVSLPFGGPQATAPVSEAGPPPPEQTEDVAPEPQPLALEQPVPAQAPEDLSDAPSPQPGPPAAPQQQSVPPQPPIAQPPAAEVAPETIPETAPQTAPETAPEQEEELIDLALSLLDEQDDADQDDEISDDQPNQGSGSPIEDIVPPGPSTPDVPQSQTDGGSANGDGDNEPLDLGDQEDEQIIVLDAVPSTPGQQSIPLAPSAVFLAAGLGLMITRWRR